MLGRKCEYLSSVMATVECPRSSWTYLGWTPWASSNVAQVCRRSCRVMRGKPVRASKGWNHGTVYGMNFDYMPELHWVLSYPFAVMLMVLVSVTLYLG